jgi:hypothetical protein
MLKFALYPRRKTEGKKKMNRRMRLEKMEEEEKKADSLDGFCILALTALKVLIKLVTYLLVIPPSHFVFVMLLTSFTM